MARSFFSKIVLCGDLGVGKTSIRRNYMGLSFVKEHVNTLGADFSLKHIPVNGDKFDLQIWDLGGQTNFESLRQKYFRGAEGALIVFDLTNRETFDNLNYWFYHLWDCRKSKDLPIMIIGNKSDLNEFVVSDEEVYSFIDKIKKENNIEHVQMKYYITSAKNGDNITECFDDLVESLYDKFLKIFNAE